MADVIVDRGNNTDNTAGWAVAVIILIVVIAGGIFWYTRYHTGAPAQPGANIQVNVPAGGSNTGGTAPSGTTNY